MPGAHVVPPLPPPTTRSPPPPPRSPPPHSPPPPSPPVALALWSIDRRLLLRHRHLLLRRRTLESCRRRYCRHCRRRRRGCCRAASLRESNGGKRGRSKSTRAVGSMAARSLGLPVGARRQHQQVLVQRTQPRVATSGDGSGERRRAATRRPRAAAPAGACPAPEPVAKMALAFLGGGVRHGGGAWHTFASLPSHPMSGAGRTGPLRGPRRCRNRLLRALRVSSLLSRLSRNFCVRRPINLF